MNKKDFSLKNSLLNLPIIDLSFLRCVAFSINAKLADIDANTENILNCIKRAEDLNCNIVAFQSLALTGNSCESLFLDSFFLDKALSALLSITEKTKTSNLLIFLGLPIKHEGNLYSAIAGIHKGDILFINALTPTKNTSKIFKRYSAEVTEIDLSCEKNVFHNILFASNIILNVHIGKINTKIAITSNETSSLMNAIKYPCTLIFSDSPTFAMTESATLNYYGSLSFSYKNATILMTPAMQESYGSAIYSNLTAIFESGKLLEYNSLLKDAESHQKEDRDIKDTLKKNEKTLSTVATQKTEDALFSYTDIDMELIGQSEEIKEINKEEEKIIKLNINTLNSPSLSEIVHPISTKPFISFKEPTEERVKSYTKSIFELASASIKTRLDSIKLDKVVLGVSGGLDSTATLLFLILSFRMHGMPINNIYAFSLPCFGTTGHTKGNAITLCKLLGCSIEEIDIKNAVTQHFKDIAQDERTEDVTFENAQARERTQVLMDKANQKKAIVIGSSDLSEIALGFSTFNGDHMSMYNILSSIPKTVLKHCIEYAISMPEMFLQDMKKEKQFNDVLISILETPISPELLRPQNEKIAQKTEDILGSYELQDFFIYNVCQHRYSPKKTLLLAIKAFPAYSKTETLSKLKIFYRRFFASQFKRNCSPEGANITGYSFSTWKLPSNASVNLYLKELDNLERQFQ